IHDILGGEAGFISRGGTIERLLETDSQYDTSLADVLSQFRESYYALEEVTRTVRNKAESYSLDPEELEALRERIGLLQSLARKYGGNVTPTAAFTKPTESNYADALERTKAYFQKAKNELTGIELSGAEEERLKQEIKNLNAQMKDKALYLSEKRRLASLELEQKVEAELKALGMEETQIKISIRWEYGEGGTVTDTARAKTEGDETERKYIITQTGLDIVEFLMASSARDTLRPLRNIASGG
ncbi:MAG TPA: hypothetical protein PLY93_06640, partial [Turneriella sp.]|nr:hypothetical protein [Turneriella sp.]